MQGNEPLEPQDVEAAADAEIVEESGSSELDVLTGQLAEAEAKAAENWDRALRIQAEMENVRRRSALDLEKAHKFALEKFANDLIPVKDSLEMGLVAGAGVEGDQAGKVIEGVELTLKMFRDVLEKHGVVEINPEGEKFNPEHHQAMTMVAVPGAAPNTIVSVMQKGYLLNERLVRPAMVVVAKAE